jgi:type IV secretion system protein VirB9
MKRWLACVLLLMPGFAQARVEPVPSNEDSRVGVIHYSAGQEIGLQALPGLDLTMLLPRGETVSKVSLSDSNAWHVSVAPGQDALVLYALRASGNASMTLTTSRQTYNVILSTSNMATNFYVVRLEGGGGATFGPSGPPKIWTPPVIVPPGTYKLKGDKAVLPTVIRDDGRKIYIQWGAMQAIPAVFALDARGREEMVDGYMRDGTFTLDRLYDQLVFRMDKIEGTARRIEGKGGK